MSKSNVHETVNASETTIPRQPWEPMKLIYVGRISEVVQGGGGKLSTTGGDPGEHRKQQGGGG